MKSSVAAASSRLLANRKCSLERRESWFGRTQAEANQMEDEGVSRYRRGWAANAMADSLDNVADTLDSAANILPGLNKPEADMEQEDANWDSCAASRTIDIPKSLYPEEMNGVTPSPIADSYVRMRKGNEPHPGTFKVADSFILPRCFELNTIYPQVDPAG
jgi:hypothetical protein